MTVLKQSCPFSNIYYNRLINSCVYLLVLLKKAGGGIFNDSAQDGLLTTNC